MQRRCQVAILLTTLLSQVGCDHGSTHSFQLPAPTTTPTGIPVPASPPVPQEITIGQTLTGDGRFSASCTTVNGWPVPCSYYEFTAPANGSVIATLSWDPNATGNILLLRLEDTNFLAQPPAWSPIHGRLTVVAGQRYQLQVGLNGSDWDGQGPYTLSMAME